MTADIASATALIVSSYVANNTVPGSELPDLIVAVGAAVAGRGSPAKVEKLVPAVPVEDSVTSDFIICLEDGKKFKSLKRHLRSAYGLTLQQYRMRWSLPADYPMVAPNYAARRSELAREHHLGIHAWRRAS